MTRNFKGNIWFSVLAFVFGIVVLPFMLAREVYQYYKYLKPCNLAFETWDAIRYGIIICIFSVFHWCFFELVLNAPTWMYF